MVSKPRLRNLTEVLPAEGNLFCEGTLCKAELLGDFVPSLVAVKRWKKRNDRLSI